MGVRGVVRTPTAEGTPGDQLISSAGASHSSFVRRSRVAHRAIVALLLLTPLIAPRGAAAQAAPAQVRVAAQALYNEAMRDMADKAYERACPKFEQLILLVPEGIGARLALGDCYQAAGKLASAWSSYSMAASVASWQGDRREPEARAAAQALWPQLAQLTVIVSPEVAALAGLEVKRAGVLLPQAQWGSPVPIDQGKHRVEATATGRKPWATTVEVQKDGVPLTVSIDPLTEVPVEVPPPVKPTPLPMNTPQAPVSPAPANTTSAPAAQTWSAQKTAGLATLGAIGVLGLGVGTFAGVRAMQAQSDSNSAPTGSSTPHCRADDKCDQQGLALRQNAISAARLSSGLFVVFGVALAGGVVLFLTTPSTRKDSAVKVGVGLTHLTIEGAW